MKERNSSRNTESTPAVAVDSKPTSKITKIWIEGAECLVPKKGTQEQRRILQAEFRKSHPAEAAHLESEPWYASPDGPYSGDDWAVFNWEWLGTDDVVKCWRSYLHITALPLIKEQSLGKVHSHSVAGVDSDDWIEFSFYLKASYAFEVLKHAGMIPQESVLMNDGEEPLSYDEEADGDDEELMEASN
jgi:hypothetical protein